jgi:hypothetical protein
MSWSAVLKTPSKPKEEAPLPVRYYIDKTEIVRDAGRTLLEQDMEDVILRVREEAERGLIHLLDSVPTVRVLDIMKSYYEVGSLTETSRIYLRDTATDKEEEETEPEITEESEVDDDFEY